MPLYVLEKLCYKFRNRNMGQNNKFRKTSLIVISSNLVHRPMKTFGILGFYHLFSLKCTHNLFEFNGSLGIMRIMCHKLVWSLAVNYNEMSVLLSYTNQIRKKNIPSKVVDCSKTLLTHFSEKPATHRHAHSTNYLIACWFILIFST